LSQITFDEDGQPASGLTLYDYQITAVNELRRKYRAGAKRLVLCAPTASGKTEMAMAIIKSSQKKGSHCLFVCDQRELVRQTSLRFAGYGIRHGILMHGMTRGLWSRTIICSAQTLVRRGFDYINKLTGREDPPDLVVIDECHTMWTSILREIKERKVTLLGLSATPFKCGKHYQDVVNVSSTNALVRRGYLSPIKVVAPNIQVNTIGVERKSDGEYVREDLGRRVQAITGDILGEWESRCDEFYGQPVQTIVFCPSVADCQDLAQRFQRRGHDFRSITYKQKWKEKQPIIDAYREGKYLGLISCSSLAKGFDVPQARVMIDAYTLRKAVDLEIQRLGRIMRIASGKKFGLLIDHSGNYLRFFDEIQRFFAEGCPKLSVRPRRVSTVSYKRKAAEMRCRCGFVLERDMESCPACGAARVRPRGKLVSRPGELTEVRGVDGEDDYLPWPPSLDLWPELCAIACRISPTNIEKASKIAHAKYWDITGRKCHREFEVIWRDPDVRVDKYCRQQYLRWKRQQADA